MARVGVTLWGYGLGYCRVGVRVGNFGSQYPTRVYTRAGHAEPSRRRLSLRPHGLTNLLTPHHPPTNKVRGSRHDTSRAQVCFFNSLLHCLLIENYLQVYYDDLATSSRSTIAISTDAASTGPRPSSTDSTGPQQPTQYCHRLTQEGNRQ